MHTKNTPKNNNLYKLIYIYTTSSTPILGVFYLGVFPLNIFDSFLTVFILKS